MFQSTIRYKTFLNVRVTHDHILNRFLDNMTYKYMSKIVIEHMLWHLILALYFFIYQPNVSQSELISARDLRYFKYLNLRITCSHFKLFLAYLYIIKKNIIKHFGAFQKVFKPTSVTLFLNFMACIFQ